MYNVRICAEMAAKLNTQLQTDWRWRDRDGNMWSVKDMRTSHLFFTLRMIWNNTLPAYMHVGDVKLYRFGAFYTDQYMVNAIIHIYDELTTRNNVEYGHQLQLAEMHRKMDQYRQLRLAHESAKS